MGQGLYIKSRYDLNKKYSGTILVIEFKIGFIE